MRLLLIGSSGFLGSHVRRVAVQAGVEVVTAGRHSSSQPGEQVLIDLTEDSPAQIGTTLAKVQPDAVVNCMGTTSGEPAALAAGNIDAPAKLVEAMLRTRSPARLVHIGSAAEYGRGTPGVPVRESCTARPVGLYGATKLGGTRAVQVAHAAGLDAVVLRVFNPVGSGAPPSSLPGMTAAEIVRAIAHNDYVRLGDLNAVRDFVDAGDVAQAVLAAATGPTPKHPLLNVGSGRAVPARELVHTLVKIAGHSPAVHENESGSPRSTDVPWQQADISAIRAALGWQPRTSLTSSLTQLWETLR